MQPAAHAEGVLLKYGNLGVRFHARVQVLPANSIFVEGYLTTPGLATAPTQRMVESLGFTVECEEDVAPAEARVG